MTLRLRWISSSRLELWRVVRKPCGLASRSSWTIRQIPTEVRLGVRHGLPEECVALFDKPAAIRRSFLIQRVGELRVEELDEICRALRALADC
jgi:mRNA-degrading endonuclease toxin of MazEF toxin-antitoxin module